MMQAASTFGHGDNNINKQLPVDQVIAGVGPSQCQVAALQLVAGCLVPLQAADQHILGCPHVALCGLPFRLSRTGRDLKKGILIKGTVYRDF